MEQHVELDQLLAVAELCAIARNLTRDQQAEIRSLASWLQDWQVEDSNGLQPAVLQFISDCACEFLGASRRTIPILAIAPQSLSTRIH